MYFKITQRGNCDKMLLWCIKAKNKRDVFNAIQRVSRETEIKADMLIAEKTTLEFCRDIARLEYKMQLLQKYMTLSKRRDIQGEELVWVLYRDMLLYEKIKDAIKDTYDMNKMTVNEFEALAKKLFKEEAEEI